MSSRENCHNYYYQLNHGDTFVSPLLLDQLK